VFGPQAYTFRMALKDIDLTSAMRRLADLRIEEAMKEGKFDNLPGAGKDIPMDDMPACEDARWAWWCVRLLRQNDVIPDEIRWRKQIDRLTEELETPPDPTRREHIVRQINELVRMVNTLGTNAMQTPVTAVK
jgi:DnaJ-like protein